MEVLRVLAYKEWVTKYKGTYLGYIWSIAHPLMLTIVFYIGFKIVMKVPIENYTLFLIVALFPWQWFVNSISSGTWTFVGNATLIKKTLFPKFLLPLSHIVVDMLHFVISIPILILALFLYDKTPFYFSWLYLIPLLLILQIGISFAFALLFGTLNLFFRDIDRFVSLSLTLLMYISPIFYAMYLIPDNLRSYFYLNPLVPLINMWRSAFMEGRIDFNDLTIFTGHLIVILSMALFVYKKYEPLFAERS
jgi:lipopolysaccharide transport system permease protein